MPSVAPPVALNCPATVVDALIAREPDDVALPKSVLPVSVVEAMSAERLALSCPPMLSTEDMVVEPVTASAEVVAATKVALLKTAVPVMVGDMESTILPVPVTELERVTPP